MAESAEGARLLSECRVTSSTEGSNPSLSATANREADVGLTSAFLLITKARKRLLLYRQLQIPHGDSQILAHSAGNLQIVSVNLVRGYNNLSDFILLHHSCQIISST